ncbi:MAG: DUF998 domain-containing protein [Candidatus Thorarchaeota archaeon]|nr:DUF998 domain-containing protein [Candidatus Thorarchaeota archaeon]
MKLSWKRLSAYLGIIGGLIFIIVTFIAMLTYPGGYSFLDNYFSELGLTVTNSIPSMLNYALFSIACTSAAVCLIPFLFAMRTVFTETMLLKGLSWIGTILGVAAAPNLSALALFAADVYPAQHGLTTMLFFLLITLGILIYSIAILLNNNYQNVYALIGFIVVIVCFLHIGAFFSPAFTMFGTALWQKLSVYALILWSAFQGYSLLKVFE